MAGARRPGRAPIAASASRCVAIVRRAGKSPPGGASCARPRRASSGPSSSTEPRSRPTSAPSGSSFTTSGQRTRSVVLPMPSTSPPRSSEQPRHHLDVADARHVGQHAFFGRQQARGQQRQRRVLVAFDSTAPDSRRPPSISSVDIFAVRGFLRSGVRSGCANVTQIDDLFAQLDAEPLADLAAAALDQPADVAAPSPRRR